MVHRALVLGCGMIGSAVVMDLARQRDVWDVTVADRDAASLQAAAARYGVQTILTDVSDSERLQAMASGCDLAVSTLPSPIACRALRAVLAARRHAVSVSFMPEEPRTLHDLACANAVTAIVDCGIAPGLSNMMVGDAAARLSRCERVAIYVGGIPVDRSAPFEYKAGFSPRDVIDEYIDPAKVVEDGRIVVKPALSEVEPIIIGGIGPLEAFLTDGLRTLLDTIDAPAMQEKTVRYPGHAAAMRALREAGLFSREPVRVGEHDIRPVDVTAALLFPQWAYREGEADLTLMRVSVVGRREAEPVECTWELVDRYDRTTGLRSMSRTTAFPATVVARLVVEGKLPPGVHPPETIGRLGFLNHVLRELDERGIRCDANVR